MNKTGVVKTELLADLFGIVLFITSSGKTVVWLETVLSSELRWGMVCGAQCSMQCLLHTKEKGVLLILAALFSVKPEESAGRILILFLFL